MPKILRQIEGVFWCPFHRVLNMRRRGNINVVGRLIVLNILNVLLAGVVFTSRAG